MRICGTFVQFRDAFDGTAQSILFLHQRAPHEPQSAAAARKPCYSTPGYINARRMPGLSHARPLMKNHDTGMACWGFLRKGLLQCKARSARR